MTTNTTSAASPSMAGAKFIRPLAIILLSVALAVGLPGNGFVVWSILRRMQKRSVTALMVLNLAVADLAVLLTAPFFLHLLTQGTWSFGLGGCLLCHYVCGVSMYASILLITAMSLDRSLAVARPFLSQKLRTKAVAGRMLAGIWVASFLLATPVLVYRTVSRNQNRNNCILKYPTYRHEAFHLFFEAFTGFLLPFLAVVASYSDIGRRLQSRRFRRSRRTGRPAALILRVNRAEAGRALAGLSAKSGPTGMRLVLARKVLIALAFLSSSVNPVLYACAGGGLLRSAGVGFVAKLLEGTGSEASSARRGGTLNQTPFTGFLLPFLAVVASYSDIGRRLQSRRFRRSRRTGRLVALIILAFAAFWLPYHVVNLAEAGRALAGLSAKSGPTGMRLVLARKVLIALAFLSSSVNPVLYACAGGGLLRSAGVGFVAKLLEGTGSEASSARRGGTLNQTVKGAPAALEPGPAESLTASPNAPEGGELN
ncbi:Leukotriene B4 receptor 1 [Tupaia chinensis]|uniref:Leukotriene B4 receptor 1 n=1 Tax=Tupaia chinensis TaxID=246437 RepID=L9L267_TUPCH|nr:Leukotriene B4 receptor 1 [Tupaia chinensis]